MPTIAKVHGTVDIHYQVANRFLQGLYQVSEIDGMNLEPSVRISFNGLKKCTIIDRIIKG